MNIYDEAIKDEYKNGIPLYKTIKALERAKKVEELLGLYRKTTLQGKYEDVMMIAKLEEELK